MVRWSSVEVRTYRNFRPELRDDRRSGWSVVIYPPRRGNWHAFAEVIRSNAPRSLEALIAEARRRVDRAVDGALDEAPRGP